MFVELHVLSTTIATSLIQGRVTSSHITSLRKNYVMESVTITGLVKVSLMTTYNPFTILVEGNTAIGTITGLVEVS